MNPSKLRRRLYRERLKRSLAEFVRAAWHVLEPETPLVWNWHLDAVCQHLEAVKGGRNIDEPIRRLLINIPPGHMKSLLVAVFWPAWVWLNHPSWRVLFCSYAMELSIRDSVRCRDVIESEWYQKTFRPRWSMKTDQNVKSYFQNTAGGFRISLAVTGKGTGFRGDAIVGDDLLNVDEFPTEGTLDNAIKVWDKRLSSRLNDMRTGARVLIMQRIHENDPAGHLVKRGTYTHLCIPTEHDPELKCSTPLGFKDPRTEPGELLFPGLFPTDVIEEAKVDLGEYSFAGQHNQKPAPPGGGIYKTHWFRFWYRREDGRPKRWMTRLEDGTIHQHEQRELPDRFWMKLQTWDMTFKKTKDTDYVAAQVWGVERANRWLLDRIAHRMSFTETCDAVRAMSRAHSDCNGKLIEDKANGPAVMDQLQDEIGGFLPVEPLGGKEARAHAAAPIVRAGNVYLPHPEVYPWVKEFMHAIVSFPMAAHDDEMDAMSQLLNHVRESIPTTLEGLTR